MHRVQKLLSNYGYCSRRKAEELIKQGRVKVNKKTISIGDKAEDTDKIYVDGIQVKKQENIYLIFNKPVGCVTAVKDKQYRTVMDYINIQERVFPVGRLDYNTSGLLILTNDGDFANRIAHPRNEIKKTYLVGINKPITNKEISKIEEGINVQGRRTPAKIKKHNPTFLEITIHEGRNRIVRNIFKEMEFKVKFLERIKIGNLGLERLKPGMFRKMSKKDIDKLFA